MPGDIILGFDGSPLAGAALSVGEGQFKNAILVSTRTDSCASRRCSCCEWRPITLGGKMESTV